MNNKQMPDRKNSKALFGLSGFFLYKLLKGTGFFKKKYRIFILYSISFASFFVFLNLLLGFFGEGINGQKTIYYIILLSLSAVYGVWASSYFYDPD